MTESFDLTVTINLSGVVFDVDDIVLHDYDHNVAVTIIDKILPAYFARWYKGFVVTTALQNLIATEVRYVLKNGLDNALDRLDDLDRTKSAK